jgi:hypothetical protein
VTTDSNSASSNSSAPDFSAPNTTALVAAVDETLVGQAPQMLLVMASTLVESVAPHGSSRGQTGLDAGSPGGALADLVKVLLTDGSPQGAALARAVSEIAGNDAVRDGTRRSLGVLRLAVPDWLYEMGHARVDGVLEIYDTLAGTRTFVIGIELRGVPNLCLVVIVDFSAGPRLIDVYVLAAGVEQVRNSWNDASSALSDDGSERSWMDYPSLAEAHSVLRDAIAGDSVEPLTTDTWPASRPFVDWAMSLTDVGTDSEDGMTQLEYHTMVLAMLSSSLGVDEFGADDLSLNELSADELSADEFGANHIRQPFDTTPLPDEEFDWTLVPAAVRTRTTEVLLLVDACANALFDTEFRTACRRYLARVAAADDGRIINRGGAVSTAAAIVWNIHRANHDLVSDRMPTVTAKAISAYVGAKSSPTSRAEAIRNALGIYDSHYVNGLQSSDYLTSVTRTAVHKEMSTHRAAIIDLSLAAN